ncbi:threonine dehydrogenase-like Zn-dependent dehydrogenase [Catenuloplanes nepalensis]|uniref:Threonine dehydrogenase-like Zn-dependent dehydrogenase n=1 Tax=Catenuloplanes nepalensis TaxID=587533 RepID=A0ABT9MR50_9ACTN|nr:alcohol dehydrogenase catalytic domain-containing protein [Catenuloplanes nepalensis]MDP9793758.1 threonine dehydrogenase-like Zn-dependent dehydrogenase [Catenuloplanes nepalensis]
MRATLLYGAGDVRIETVPDAVLSAPTDALVRVTAACICGTDLWPYESMPAGGAPAPMGHELIGVVEDVGAEVTGVARGDVVVVPWFNSCGSCEFCREGLYTACPAGGMWGYGPLGGGQAEAIRVPFADGTLVKLPAATDPALLPSLLTLSDVLGTGHHAAVSGGVAPGTDVTVIGDGAVGLLAVLAARRLGAQRIILMGRHTARTDLGREFGATDVVAARGAEGIEALRELTGGLGTRVVIEAVGSRAAYEQALGVVRRGGTISRVGVPQYEEAPIGMGSLFTGNVRLTGGAAPTRAYAGELLPDILAGTIDPGRVFDVTTGLDGVPDGYRRMADRKSLKVLIRP